MFEKSEKYRQRLVYVDWMKTICIFLVLLGHILSDEYRAFIYSFHIPALFIISGFLNSEKNVLKKVFALFIPVFVFSIIRRSYFNFHDFLDNPLELSFTGLWYIVDIAILRLLFSIKYVMKIWHILFVICIVICEILSYMLKDNGPNNFLFYLFPTAPFFCIGLFLRNNGVPHPLSFVNTIIGLLIGFVWSYFQGNCYIYPFRFPLGFILYSIGAVFLTYVLYSICFYMKGGKIAITYSSGSLVLLGMNAVLLDLFNCLCVGKLYHYWWIVSFLGPILVCYPIILICERFLPILLGKYKFRLNVQNNNLE